MPNFNKVLLMGNLTRDPELRYTPSGTPVASFGLAVNRTWKDANGQQVNDTLFVDITAFSGLADTISRYCRKGSPLFVEGRLKLDTWEDKQTGQRRSRLHVVMEAMQLLSSRQDFDQGGGYAPRPNPGAYGAAPQSSYPNVPPAQPPYGTQSAAYAPPPSSGMPPMPPAAADPSMEDDVPF